MSVSVSRGPIGNNAWTGWKPILLGCLFAGFVHFARSSPGAESDTRAERDNRSALRREVVGLIRQLDSDRFESRRQAALKLQQLKADPLAPVVLAEEFQRVLLSSDTPFEVRRQVERLRSGLPAVAARRQETVSVEEIRRLMSQLEDDRYGIRFGAKRRLEWLLGNSKLACPIYRALGERLDGPNVSLDTRQWMEPICLQARVAWLTSDPVTWDLPAVNDAQIEAWVEEAAQPASDRADPGRARTRQKAVRELRDLLARDAYVGKVVQAVETRLARGDVDSRAVRRLQELIDLTKPAMVAEFWQGRRHSNTQHLLIGVPSQTPGAERASHFEYIDDDVAFCLSGQNLSPGNYPVGVAIPHPKSLGAMFHLVNLSTPRHKMVYECVTQGDQGKRLAEMTRRTLQRFLAAKQRLSLEELLLLEQLDPGDVSRFAGQYFLAVDDEAIPEEIFEAGLGRPMMAGPAPLVARSLGMARASRHGVICCVLAASGTQTAMPGLRMAIEKGRFLAPTRKAPYQLPWIALLAIASRDPWPGVDACLAQVLGRTDALIAGRERGPELGATAAAVLLARHGIEPVQFGLKEADDPLFASVDLAGYRFETPGAPQRMAQWWSEHHADNQP